MVRIKPNDKAPTEFICREKMMIKTIKQFSDLMTFSDTKIAFFAGSFDPIHDGHIKIVEFVLEQFVNHVIICVHSHNDKKNPIPIRERFEIIKRVLSASPFRHKIRLCDTMFLHGIENEHFIQIAERLMELNIKVFILKGQDSLLGRSKYPLADLPHLIHNRGKVEIPLHDILRGPVIRFQNLSTMSSTKARKKIAAGKRVHCCGDTHNYILEKKYYT